MRRMPEVTRSDFALDSPASILDNASWAERPIEEWARLVVEDAADALRESMFAVAAKPHNAPGFRPMMARRHYASLLCTAKGAIEEIDRRWGDEIRALEEARND